MTFVSVIMPCFNHGRFVAESIASVLAQTHRALELIVVDDASVDDSAAVIGSMAMRDSRLRLVRHPRNLGASRSRNDGLALARGDVVCFCDADDQWIPEKLAIQLELLDRHPECDIAYSDSRIIDAAGRETGEQFSDRFPAPARSHGVLLDDLCRRNFINMPTTMIRRSCLTAGARFDERVRWVEDWLFWIRLSRRHAFVYMSQPLAKYRVHSQSTGITQQRGIAQNRFKVFSRVLATIPDDSSVRTAQLLYHMGCALRDAGRPRLARRVLRRAVGTALAHWRSAPHCMRPLGRLVVGGG